MAFRDTDVRGTIIYECPRCQARVEYNGLFTRTPQVGSLDKNDECRECGHQGLTCVVVDVVPHRPHRIEFDLRGFAHRVEE